MLRDGQPSGRTGACRLVAFDPAKESFENYFCRAFRHMEADFMLVSHTLSARYRQDFREGWAAIDPNLRGHAPYAAVLQVNLPPLPSPPRAAYCDDNRLTRPRRRLTHSTLLHCTEDGRGAAAQRLHDVGHERE